MTRRKQPWGQQRGWIVPADGSPPQELPRHMVGHKLISWPGTMPEKQPAEPVKSARPAATVEGLGAGDATGAGIAKSQLCSAAA